MKKQNAVIILIVTIILTAIGCSTPKINEPNTPISEERDTVLNITTTNKSLYYMVKDIIGDKHNVDYMFKDEKSLWSFVYSDDSLNNIAKKDLFIYMGSNYEPWVPAFNDNIKKSKVGMINASRGVKILNLTKSKTYGNKEIKENPYYVMSIDNYKIALLNIKNAVQDKDPKNRQFYEQNFNNKIKILDEKADKLKSLADELKEFYVALPNDNSDYLIEYLGLKSIKLNDVLKNEEEVKKFDDKVKDKKGKMLFLYTEDAEKELYEPLILKYSMKPLKTQGINGDMEYGYLLDELIKNLQNIINIK